MNTTTDQENDAVACPVQQAVRPQRWTSVNAKPAEHGGFVAYGDHMEAVRSAVAAERVQIAARIREAWHQREASHGNRAGEYHEGMLAGLDAAVALALGPNV